MSGAEVLRDMRRKWAQYKTLPPSQGVSTQAPTTVGTAYQLRSTPRYWQDVAHYVDLVLEQLERLTRRVEALEAGQPPVPLVLPEGVEAELHYLRNKADALRHDIDGQGGLHERLVAVEYATGRNPHAHEAWLVGLAVVAALVSSGSAVVCVSTVLVWLRWGGGT